MLHIWSGHRVVSHTLESLVASAARAPRSPFRRLAQCQTSPTIATCFFFQQQHWLLYNVFFSFLFSYTACGKTAERERGRGPVTSGRSVSLGGFLVLFTGVYLRSVVARVDATDPRKTQTRGGRHRNRNGVAFALRAGVGPCTFTWQATTDRASSPTRITTGCGRELAATEVWSQEDDGATWRASDTPTEPQAREAADDLEESAASRCGEMRNCRVKNKSKTTSAMT